MTCLPVDYQTVFSALPSPCMVLSPDLVIADVNEVYSQVTGKGRDDLVGQYLFDAFPDNPADPDADGPRNLIASLQRVLRTRQPDAMAVHKYDIPQIGRPDRFEERWWSSTNIPLLGPQGQMAWIIHHTEDVTEFVLSRHSRPHAKAPGRWEATAGAVCDVAQLHGLNEELRKAHSRERRIAVTLQEAMLSSPDLARHPDIAVRYLPAAGSLNVCGDWYDVVDLPQDCVAIAVGDVIGHGLEAAAIMGMLRSSLSSAIRALHHPARAMEVLGLYARSVEGALATTAVDAVINRRQRHITYSNAGHPPPVLARPDGTLVPLDQATDPPLGARPQHVPRPQASVPYTPGSTLLLYTDGLIERRGEDIDVGLHRLADALTRHHDLSPEQLADALLSRLGVSDGGRDDIALVACRL